MHEVLKRQPDKLMLLILFFSFIILGSCKKFDTYQNLDETIEASYAEKFFNTHRTGDSRENAIVSYVKRINEKENFVNNAVKQIGFPRWDKITLYASKYGSNSFASSNDSTHIYFIPFVRDSQNFVNASLIIVANPSDTTFRFKYDWQYLQMQNSPNSVQDTAEKFAILFMRLDKAVFGHKKFSIIDNNLFKRNGKNAVWAELLDSAAQNNLDAPLSCTDVTFTWEDCPYPGNCAGVNGTCDRCPDCMSSLTYTYCMDSGSGSSSGGSGIPTGGGPSGPSGNGGCSGCGGGGSGTTPPSTTTPGWTYYQPIEDYIDNNPCDTLSKYALANNFQLIFQDLKNKVASRTENLYIVHNLLNPTSNSNPLYLTNGHNDAFSVYPTNEAQFVNSWGWFHNHFADSDSASLIFSAGDLNILAEQIVRDSNYFQIDYKRFMIGVISDSSAQYILMVDNINTFKLWATTTAKYDVAIDGLFYGEKLTQEFLPLSKAESEKRFLKVIQNAGLKLFRGSNDFTTWTGLKLNNTGTEVINSPCL